MQPRSPLEPVLAHVRAEPSRTWSIIITFFGDAVVPRGGDVWLGTLLAFFKGMEISETVVRSAVSRLAAEDWLVRTKRGRNSFYHLAERGQDTFAQATRRIYYPHRQRWNGAFEALMVENGAREAMAETLKQAGFGMPMPGLFIALDEQAMPAPAPGMVRLNLGGSTENLRNLAAKAWNLTALAGFYQQFAEVFTPLRQVLAQGVGLSLLEAILARVLLIHAYRRIALRDPMLPVEILPVDWPGETAQALCAEIYEKLLVPSEAWLNANMLAGEACSLPENSEIYTRFSS